MAFILISWFYILLITTATGSIIQPLIKTKEITFLIVSGLFVQLILVHFWALFLPVNQAFYLFNSVLAGFVLFFRRFEIKSIWDKTKADFKGLNIFVKLIFCFVFLAVLMQSSVYPFLPDNESYYIQSIKWLNQYGLVKGLANLHFFFGQSSGWHLLQSSFNFGFWFDFLNDVNGFLAVVVAFFSFKKLNNFFQNKKLPDLFVGLIFTASLFLFRFLDAPSPDFPVFLIFPLMVWIFIENYEKPKSENIILLFIFGLLLCLIKITAFPVLMLAGFSFLKFKLNKRINLTIISLGLISVIAFCSKNYILTGFLFFPTNIFGSFLQPDWKLPSEMRDFYYNLTSFYPFFSNDFDKFEEFKQMSEFEKLMKWINNPGIDGIFNKIIVGLLLIFPFLIRKNKSFLWIYLTGLIGFLILFITSPQYRFFFHIVLVFGLLIAATILIKLPSIITKSILLLSLFLSVLPMFFSLNVSGLTDNTMFIKQNNRFEITNIFIPKPNFRYKHNYKLIKEGNLEFNSPESLFFYSSGNGPLPSANRQMVYYFKKRFGLRPQLRTGELKDGFYSEKLKK